jgi:Phage capsid family
MSECQRVAHYEQRISLLRGKPTLGLRFKKQILLECSLVSIPANENALAVARSLNISEETKRLVFGKPAATQRKSKGTAMATTSTARRRASSTSRGGSTLPSSKSFLVRPRDHLVRCVRASAQFHTDSSADYPKDFIRKTWGEDRATLALFERAASGPASTTAVGWAAEVVAQAVPDFLRSLGPASAGAQLLGRGIELQLGEGATYLSVPGLTATAGGAGFVAEGQPAPVYQYDASGNLLLSAHKIMANVVLTRELLWSPSVEALIHDLLARSVGLALDKQLFSSSPATGQLPPGILNSVAPLTATSGGTADALRIDIGNLANSVAAVGGLNVAFVCDPKSAMKIALARGPGFTFDVLTSGAFTTPTVICVAVDALASLTTAGGVRIVSSPDAVLHFDDASPVHIVTAGSVASTGTVRSVWQTDSVATKVTFDVSWGLRVPTGAVAYLISPTW